MADRQVKQSGNTNRTGATAVLPHVEFAEASDVGGPAAPGAASPPPAPRWMEPKKHPRTAPAPQPIVAETDQPQFPWWRRLLVSLAGYSTAGFLASLALHTLLLLVLSLLWIRNPQSVERVIFGSTSPDAEEVDFAAQLDSRLEQSAADEEPAAPIQFVDMVQRDSDLTMSTFDPSDTLRGSLDGRGEGGGQGDGVEFNFDFKMPEKVVTKGSFTAWTVPEDPDPGENYLIVIQVKLPDRIKRYPKSDLSGIVRGTDRYEQPISRLSTFKVDKNAAQLIVRVPGGAERVRDTIEIRSRRLREKQVLRIEF